MRLAASTNHIMKNILNYVVEYDQMIFIEVVFIQIILYQNLFATFACKFKANSLGVKT